MSGVWEKSSSHPIFFDHTLAVGYSDIKEFDLAFPRLPLSHLIRNSRFTKKGIPYVCRVVGRAPSVNSVKTYYFYDVLCAMRFRNVMKRVMRVLRQRRWSRLYRHCVAVAEPVLLKECFSLVTDYS
jgi:hypothetical protein